MSYELAVMNPRRKRNSKGRFVKSSKRRRKHKVKSSHRRKYRRNPVAVAAPRRRRKRHVAKIRRRTRVAVYNPRRRKYRANPKLFSFSGIKSAILPAAIGAGGAIALDVGLSYLPVPDYLKTGLPRHAFRAAGALALGLLASKFLGREKGRAVGAGALTVVMYGALKDVVKQFAPNLPGLAGNEDYVSYDLGSYINPAPTLNAYLPGGAPPSVQAAQQAMGGMNAYMGGEEDYEL